MATTIKLENIVHDARLQLRVKGLDETHVADLAEAIKRRKKVGAIKACRHGKEIFPFDGWHRIEAAKRAGKDEIDAELEDGDLSLAILRAASANSSHGLKRTNADKRAAVESVLNHPNAGDWSDGKIADYVGVSQNFVSDVRHQLKSDLSSTDETQQKTEPEVRVGRDGKKRKVAKKKPKKDEVGDTDALAETVVIDATPPANGKAVEPTDDNPFREEARRMELAAGRLSQLAADVQKVSEEVSKFTGDGFRSLVNKDNIDMALSNIVDHLRVHANSLRAAAPACMCLDCEGRGCQFCANRRYQTVAEKKEAEARKKARVKVARPGAVA